MEEENGRASERLISSHSPKHKETLVGGGRQRRHIVYQRRRTQTSGGLPGCLEYETRYHVQRGRWVLFWVLRHGRLKQESERQLLPCRSEICDGRDTYALRSKRANFDAFLSPHAS